MHRRQKKLIKRLKNIKARAIVAQTVATDKSDSHRVGTSRAQKSSNPPKTRPANNQFFFFFFFFASPKCRASRKTNNAYTLDTGLPRPRNNPNAYAPCGSIHQSPGNIFARRFGIFGEIIAAEAQVIDAAPREGARKSARAHTEACERERGSPVRFGRGKSGVRERPLVRALRPEGGGSLLQSSIRPVIGSPREPPF